jgi:hypothetical protein
MRPGRAAIHRGLGAVSVGDHVTVAARDGATKPRCQSGIACRRRSCSPSTGDARTRRSRRSLHHGASFALDEAGRRGSVEIFPTPSRPTLDFRRPRRGVAGCLRSLRAGRRATARRTDTASSPARGRRRRGRPRSLRNVAPARRRARDGGRRSCCGGGGRTTRARVGSSTDAACSAARESARWTMSSASARKPTRRCARATKRERSPTSESRSACASTPPTCAVPP